MSNLAIAIRNDATICISEVCVHVRILVLTSAWKHLTHEARELAGFCAVDHLKCCSGMHVYLCCKNRFSSLGMHICCCCHWWWLLSHWAHAGSMLLLKGFVALLWAQHFDRALFACLTGWCTSVRFCFFILNQAFHCTQKNFNSFSYMPNIGLSNYEFLMLDDELCHWLLERSLKIWIPHMHSQTV